MSIIFDKTNQVFLLNTISSSYIIKIFANQYILHYGWFPKIDEWNDMFAAPVTGRAMSPNPEIFEGKLDFSLDTQPQEFSGAGITDFRNSSIEIKSENGTIATDLIFKSYRILKGKPQIPGLPATYSLKNEEADTLEIDFMDPLTEVTVILSYTVWKNYNAICRHTVVKNTGKYDICLEKVMSCNVDFCGSRYKMLQLSGAHARERHPVFRKLVPGNQGIESKRTASSLQQNPFIALMDYDASETRGNVYGFNLVYSGNFYANVEVDQFNMSRVQLGINPFNFEWKIKPEEEFYTPEAVMVYSQNGLGEMSRTFHDLYRNHLCRGKWQYKERPIVINNWEATYFNFNAEKLFKLADEASSAGIELFVLDDGWFGKRNDDTSSLGDWFENKEKLPGGLAEISDGIHKRGLKFGLWFEPEMVSPDSNLFRNHPDWCLHIEGRSSSLSRHQLMLDLSRNEVVDYLYERLYSIITENKIDYVKWDFNRSGTEVGSGTATAAEQMKVSHKYYLGLYNLMEKITSALPDVLFESCSSGGGRYDPGMLYYMPQAWTSDNTDGISRLAIQAGSTIAYPASSMSCHVSAVPNHQTGRQTFLAERGHTAMAGTFGYELDLNKLNPVELKEIKDQVEIYKTIRKTVQFGDYYRLENPWTESSDAEITDFTAWNIVSKDKNQAVFTIVWNYPEANAPADIIKLQGLDESKKYKLTCPQSKTIREFFRLYSPFPMPEAAFYPFENDIVVSGDLLMKCGLQIPYRPHFGSSIQIILNAL
ncbi:MAG: alpha-galactosidase [Treponema sp.]|nr:alpha-galactosidase [Treponema sp.]